jgi:hypothetical protein
MYLAHPLVLAELRTLQAVLIAENEPEEEDEDKTQEDDDQCYDSEDDVHSDVRLLLHLFFSHSCFSIQSQFKSEPISTKAFSVRDQAACDVLDDLSTDSSLR